MATYRGASTEQRQERRRAALDSLHEDGLAGVSVRSVCARSRLTPRYFYENFADLDALLAAAVDAIADEIISSCITAVDDADSLEDKVRDAIDAGYGVVADDRRKATAILVCAAGHASLRTRRHGLLVRFAEVILSALPLVQAPGTAAEIAEARPLALFLMGGAAEVIEAVLSGALPLSREQVVGRLSRMWLSTLELSAAPGSRPSAG